MNTPKKIVIFGGSFNPPGLHHVLIAIILAKIFDLVIIKPCGNRPDKQSTNDISFVFRAAMMVMTFLGLNKVVIDLDDFEKDTFTRTREVDAKYKRKYPDAEIYHFVGWDLINGGQTGTSQIQSSWQHGNYLWNNLKWVVGTRTGYPFDRRDLPPNSMFIEDMPTCSSTKIRETVMRHEPFEKMVVQEVARLIKQYGLYQGKIRLISSTSFEHPKLFIFKDERNEAAIITESLLRKMCEVVDKPIDSNLITALGGDGIALRAVDSCHQFFKPFLGINRGSKGFLLNDIEDASLGNIFNDQLLIHHCPMLRVRLTRSDGTIDQITAFNDAHVVRAIVGTIWMKVSIDGRVVHPKLVGDGILVATPQGSTAYARSMGATPITIDTESLVLVGNNISPDCGWKSMSLPQTARITIEAADGTNPEKRPMIAHSDHKNHGTVTKMEIDVSPTASAELVYTKTMSLAEKIMQINFPHLSLKKGCQV